MITITVCISQNAILLIQQHIIHCPGVDRHAHRDFAQFLAFLHAVQDLTEQPVHIPQKLSVLMIHAVLETVDLF